MEEGNLVLLLHSLLKIIKLSCLSLTIPAAIVLASTDKMICFVKAKAKFHIGEQVLFQGKCFGCN